MPNINTSNRIVIIDALRGFSLAGIVIVHMVENYAGAPVPEGAMEAARLGLPDYIVDGFIFLFLRGKFFALFSFLFGLSFFIQMDSANKRGQDFKFRFLWRLVLLFGIGYVHHLFYRGDILTIYAVLGLFLIPFYKIPAKYVLTIAGLLFLGLGRYIVFAFSGGDNLFMEGEFSPSSPEIVAYYETIKNGSLWEVFKSNATEGQLMKMDFQLGIFSRGYLTYAFFLMGLIVGRMQFFKNFLEQRKLTLKVMWWSLGIFVVSIGLTAMIFAPMGPNVTFDNWRTMVGLTALDLNNLGMTGIILAGFVLLYHKAKASKLLSGFAPYGRMALTNYVTQSLIGTFILYGWGLGYLGELRNVYTFIMAILLIALQMLASRYWLKRYYYGPLEWLWRSLTHTKIYPLLRK
ncbi:MAG: DUF418 domain-containing protein [Flavobacteriaceae bacterium]